MSLGFIEDRDIESGGVELLGPAYLRVTCEQGVLMVYADLPGNLFRVNQRNENVYNDLRDMLNPARRAKLDQALKSCQEFLERMKSIGTDGGQYTEMEILWSEEF